MKNFRNNIDKNKWLVIFYLTWTFIHTLLLINGENYDGFWPFEGLSKVYQYGGAEFFVYQFIPLLVFVIYKLIGEDLKKYRHLFNSIKKNIAIESQKRKTKDLDFIPERKIKKSDIIFLMIISLIMWFMFYSSSMWMRFQGMSSNELDITGTFLLLILRIWATVQLSKKAKEIKKNSWFWGVVGFLFPIISLIVMIIKINKLNKLNRVFRQHNVLKNDD